MAKKQSDLEWIILSETERDWEGDLLGASGPELALAPTEWRKWQWWGGAALVLILLSGGAFALWQHAEEGIAQIEAEVDEAAKVQTQLHLDHDKLAVALLDKQMSAQWQHSMQEEMAHLPAAFDEGASITVADFVFEQDIATVQVVLRAKQESTAYRQTRFYRSTDKGWLRTAPNIPVWGPSRSLETEYFIFEFHQRDAEAVAAVALQVDTLYTTIRSNFGVSVAQTDPKLPIQVDITQPPGTLPVWVDPDDPFSVPSPGLYLAPVGLTDADLLVQALALRMVEYVSIQAQARYAIPQAWPPAVYALRLWQLWDLELPLSTWQDEVVAWVYADTSMSAFGQPVTPPEYYSDLCAMHTLWMESPQMIGIPLECEHTEGLEMKMKRWYPVQANMDLVRWRLPTVNGYSVYRSYGIEHPGKVVALATFFEYAVVTYGRNKLPAIIAGFGTYDSWEKLLPAVLGVSASDFEGGWRNYLVQHYGVRLEH